MTIQEIEAEVERVNKALEKTKSQKLKNDYEKYLKRLKREYLQSNRGRIHEANYTH